MKTFRIFYDGDCPVCSRYVAMTQLRKEFDVQLMNVREHLDAAERFRNSGVNVDDGMIVDIDGQIYYGSEAMHIISLYENSPKLLNRLMRAYFRNRVLSRMTYPLLRHGRNLLLFLLGRKKLFPK